LLAIELVSWPIRLLTGLTAILGYTALTASLQSREYSHCGG